MDKSDFVPFVTTLAHMNVLPDDVRYVRDFLNG